jgi:hypothetical protein
MPTGIQLGKITGNRPIETATIINDKHPHPSSFPAIIFSHLNFVILKPYFLTSPLIISSLSMLTSLFRAKEKDTPNYVSFEAPPGALQITQKGVPKMEHILFRHNLYDRIFGGFRNDSEKRSCG